MSSGSVSSGSGSSTPDDADLPVLGTGDSDPNPFMRALNAVPRVLSSKLHIIGLFALGIYIVVLPLFGLRVSDKAELIGGNYENTTSDIGACIAAGGTVHLIRKGKERHREIVHLHAKLDALLARQGMPDAGGPHP
jgi:hypothetical protein